MKTKSPTGKTEKNRRNKECVVCNRSQRLGLQNPSNVSSRRAQGEAGAERTTVSTQNLISDSVGSFYFSFTQPLFRGPTSHRKESLCMKLCSGLSDVCIAVAVRSGVMFSCTFVPWGDRRTASPTSLFSSSKVGFGFAALMSFLNQCRWASNCRLSGSCSCMRGVPMGASLKGSDKV